jgi:hypothetical protein
MLQTSTTDGMPTKQKNFALAEWAMSVCDALKLDQDEFAARLGHKGRSGVARWSMAGAGRQNPGRDAVLAIMKIRPKGFPPAPGYEFLAEDAGARPLSGPPATTSPDDDLLLLGEAIGKRTAGLNLSGEQLQRIRGEARRLRGKAFDAAAADTAADVIVSLLLAGQGGGGR